MSFKISVLLIFFILFVQPLYAGESTGYVTALLVTDDGRVLVEAGEHIDMPGCVTQTLYGSFEFKTDAGRGAGQAMLSLLLSAQDSHQVVTIIGRGDCQNERERVFYIKK